MLTVAFPLSYQRITSIHPTQPCASLLNRPHNPLSSVILNCFEGARLYHPSAQFRAGSSALDGLPLPPTRHLPSILFYFSQLDYDKLEVLRLWVNLLAVRRCDYWRFGGEGGTIAIHTVTQLLVSLSNPSTVKIFWLRFCSTLVYLPISHTHYTTFHSICQELF